MSAAVSLETLVKVCRCGAAYTADEWAALRHIGDQDDDAGVLEMRNCSACDSTLAIITKIATDVLSVLKRIAAAGGERSGWCWVYWGGISTGTRDDLCGEVAIETGLLRADETGQRVAITPAGWRALDAEHHHA